MNINTDEFKVVSIRKFKATKLKGNAKDAAQYWRKNIETKHFNSEVENAAVLLLDTRGFITGHVMIGMGTLDEVIIHPRDVFRVAIIAGAHSIMLMHNHPTGDVSPSACDYEVTMQLSLCGRMLKVPLVDHVIVSGSKHTSVKIDAKNK